jgi:3-oxoacyl-[acyl-carrier protein] reductase
VGIAAQRGGRELEGRVAIVTGGGRNIGRAIALALAEGGASVVINARSNRAEIESVAQEIAQGGGQALAFLADVTEVESVERMAAAALARFGRLDMLVNNAALRKESPIDQMAHEEWREVMATILDGAFNCVKACVQHLRQGGNGVIVNIGGLTAHTGARHRAHVVAAKAGLVGLTRALAHDFAADRITVNCVSPGLIATARGGTSPVQPDHHRTSRTLTGERGAPDDVARTVRFLCGPGARYITGQTLHVNGGAFLG